MDQILQWFEANAGKIIFLLVAIVAALLITKGLARVMRKVLDRTDMPSASIFINIMRVLVWILAASIVLQPVFGISPTTLMTALGVGRRLREQDRNHRAEQIRLRRAGLDHRRPEA